MKKIIAFALPLVDTGGPTDITNEFTSDNIKSQEPARTEKQSVMLNDYDEFSSGDGKELELNKGDKAQFIVDGELHSAKVKQVGGDFVILTIASTPRDVRLETGQTKSYDSTNDDKDDITIMLASIHDGTATLGFSVPSVPQAENTTTLDDTKTTPSSGVDSWLLHAAIGAALW